MNEVKIGDKIKIIAMEGEPICEDKVGTVTSIDDMGQLHGTWGGIAIIPDLDEFIIISRSTL